MKVAKSERLRARGWVVGDALEFLELTEEEAAFVERELALTDGMKPLRCTLPEKPAGLRRRPPHR